MRHFTPVLGFVLIGATVLATAGAAAATPRDLLVNGSAEQAGEGNAPAGWFTARVPAAGLTMERTGSSYHSGKYSLFISNEHEYESKVSNNWAQKIEPAPERKTVRLEAWMRTQDAEAVNVCVQCWSDEPHRMLAFASTPVVRGTQDWTGSRSRAIVVPPETKKIMVRAALTGLGKAWFDDLSLTIVDEEPAAATQKELSPDDREQLAKLAGGKIFNSVPITKDCMVLAYLPDWSHGNVDNIAVANNSGGVRTLLAWDSESLAKSVLSKNNRRALIALYSRRTTAGPDSGTVQVRSLRDSWPELTSWKTQPDSSNEVVAEHDFVPGEGWKLFDVTSLVQKQLESGEKCHGVILQFQRESFVSDTWSGYAFASREGLGEWAGRHPHLLIVESPKRP